MADDKSQSVFRKARLPDDSMPIAARRLRLAPDPSKSTWVPIAGMLAANLSEEQTADVRAILDGMLRERSKGGGTAILTNPVQIGIGRK